MCMNVYVILYFFNYIVRYLTFAKDFVGDLSVIEIYPRLNGFQVKY